MVKPEQPARSAYRLLVLAFFALLALSLLVVTVVTWSSRDYAFGWNLAPNGTVRRGSAQRTITLAPRPVSDITEHARRVSDLARIVLIITGILLVQMRPSRMTWGFLLSRHAQPQSSRAE